MAQLDIGAELIGKMKQGDNLYVQYYTSDSRIVTLRLPLGRFAQVYEGAPTPKAFEERNTLPRIKDDTLRWDLRPKN